VLDVDHLMIDGDNTNRVDASRFKTTF